MKYKVTLITHKTTDVVGSKTVHEFDADDNARAAHWADVLARTHKATLGRGYSVCHVDLVEVE